MFMIRSHPACGRILADRPAQGQETEFSVYNR